MIRRNRSEDKKKSIFIEKKHQNHKKKRQVKSCQN